ncbi:hypothetical protein B4U79_10088, partial [Dinothrombium tinctorium]
EKSAFVEFSDECQSSDEWCDDSLLLTGKSRRFANRFEDSGFFEKQFEKPSPKIPWKAIVLAVFLFVAGINAICYSLLTLIGRIENRIDDGTFVLLILGFFMFIPGYYHVRIAYYAFKRYPGYSFDDIPDFD